MDSFPESFHPLDMRRFYVFVKTVGRYRSKKWRNYAYFKRRILEHIPHFSEENIDHFWETMQTCLEFHKTNYIDSTIVGDDSEYGYKQVGVKNGKIYETPITSEEFLQGGKKV